MLLSVRHTPRAAERAPWGPQFRCMSSVQTTRIWYDGLQHKALPRSSTVPRRIPTRTVLPVTSHRQLSTISSSPYPSRDDIRDLFDNMAKGNYPAFFEQVSPDVDWTIMGTHPCAARYKTLKEFQQGTLTRLSKIMKGPGFNLTVRNVIGGGDQEWATVELVANAECLNRFKFDSCYSWCCRFDKSGVIVEVRAYLDSWMVRQAIIENETPSHRAPVPDVGKF